jgi:hypothetical protein
MKAGEAILHIALSPINDFIGVGVEGLSDLIDRGSRLTLQNHFRAVNRVLGQGPALGPVE